MNSKKMVLIKKITIFIILVILVNFIFINFNVSYSNETENIAFLDNNLKTALLNEGIDSNGDGEISYDEAKNVTMLHLYNKNISNLYGLRYFENVDYLELSNNNIEDISECLNMTNLKTLLVSHNKLNLTPLRHYDESMETVLETLINNGVHIEGTLNQVLEYNPSLITTQPVYKVLFVYVTEIDVDVDNQGNVQNYKHELSEEEIYWFDKQREVFEKAIEKMSNYAVNIVTEVYNTTEIITEYGIGSRQDDYWLNAHDIEEIAEISNEYDTVFVCSIYDRTIVPHTAGGLGGRGEAMVYFEQGNYSEDIDKLERNALSNYLPPMIHEFIHSVELYGTYMDFDIWGWHDAQAYYATTIFDDNSQNIYGESMYLQGTRNPENPNETGIIKELWEIPLSKIYGKDIVTNKNEINLEKGDEEQIYCATKIIDTTPASSALWTFKNIIWSSSNNKIATIDENGIIHANSPGRCVITAKDSSQTYETTVIVNVTGENDVNEDFAIIDNNNIYVKLYEGRTIDEFINLLDLDDSWTRVIISSKTNGERNDVEIIKGETDEQILDIILENVVGVVIYDDWGEHGYEIHQLGNVYLASTSGNCINVEDLMCLRRALVRDTEVINNENFDIKATDINLSNDEMGTIGDIGDVIALRKIILNSGN